jgi:hypothetical protein
MRWIVAAIVVAIAAGLGWRHAHSEEARIARAYDACMKRFGGQSATPPASPAPADATAAESIGKAMQDLVRGVTANMSGAVCGGVRDACRADFDGAVCQNALAGFKDP